MEEITIRANNGIETLEIFYDESMSNKIKVSIKKINGEDYSTTYFEDVEFNGAPTRREE